MHDACGVVGISFNETGNNVAKSIYYALYALQHRGQEAAGISVHDGKAIRTHRGMGLVSEVFDDAQIALLARSGGHRPRQISDHRQVVHREYPAFAGQIQRRGHSRSS